jgi:hypothetical protein
MVVGLDSDVVGWVCGTKINMQAMCHVKRNVELTDD